MDLASWRDAVCQKIHDLVQGDSLSIHSPQDGMMKKGKKGQMGMMKGMMGMMMGGNSLEDEDIGA